ncbi:hypothetical protein BLNAU_9522 [Blattamonas nauphoetae]|uniref:Uncharacterized protein n=1 Tax=Blattamonas nauphoetae TaxID=2049346 RepID=A0ABQ9XVI4_9EUKA|nr:hypothetical protein BLNAU_9522 [Blattamonas nauphoetae]
MFLTDDLFKKARESIHAESLLRLRKLGRNDTETATMSFNSQAGSISTPSQSQQLCQWIKNHSHPLVGIKPRNSPVVELEQNRNQSNTASKSGVSTTSRWTLVRITVIICRNEPNALRRGSKPAQHFIEFAHLSGCSYELDLYHNFMWMTEHAYGVVSSLETIGHANHVNRLTDSEDDYDSPAFFKFSQLIDRELVEVSKQFDPDLFEEARRISSWKDFLQKVAGGEEVENDTSFLKLPFFEPTLLSLQAKYQNLTSSLDGSVGSSTSSPHSSHYSPHTSLESHLESSLRTHSSSHFKHESLLLLTILHSLITSPLPPSLHKYSTPDLSNRTLHLIQREPVSLDERFYSSLFDEPDTEKLARLLIRCRSVCRLVGAEKCIDDIQEFFKRTVSILESSDALLRSIGFSLFRDLIDTSSILPLLPDLWDGLRFSFRDGRPEEQAAIIWISSIWILKHLHGFSLPSFPAKGFDWDGLISADLSDRDTFLFSVLVIIHLRNTSIEIEVESAKTTDIILSFEQHQNAVPRIVSIFNDPKQLEDIRNPLPFISYCLLISLLSSRDFPPFLTTLLTQHPDIDANTLLPNESHLFLLCHASLNPHKPHQPPLDFLFERTLRMNPLSFFVCFKGPDAISSSLLDSSLCGFHALCRRGVHFDLMETEYVNDGDHLVNSYWMFSTPYISDTFRLFLHFPPPLVVRFFLPILSSKSAPSSLVDPLKVMLTNLLFTTAPFGDLQTSCESLEWLNIPTGFGSALVHSKTHASFDSFDNQDGSPMSTDDSLESSKLTSIMQKLLSKLTRGMRDGLKLVGSPVPAEVSVNLEFVKRLVSLGSVESVMQMVRFGMLDCVIRGVSESSFLEDYENGICVIGIVLRSICGFGKKQAIVDHDFSHLLSRPGQTFSMDCFPFLNWDDDDIVSAHEQAVIFLSLSATVKVQPAPDDSLKTKVVNFLESVDTDDEEAADTFLSRIASFSDQSMSDFVQSIVTLLSTSSEAIAAATMAMLHRLLQNCSDEILFALVKADLISQLIVTLDPQSVSLSDCEDMHTCLIDIITKSFRLAAPHSLATLRIEDGYERPFVYETIFQKVLSPSEKYVYHLYTNRYSIVDGDQSAQLMCLLGRLLRISPYHQPTMDTVLVLPVVLAIPSCLSFFEVENSIWCFLNIFVTSKWEWHKVFEMHQKWKKVHPILRLEGIEDVMEEKLQNDQNSDGFYGPTIVATSIKLNNLQGINLPNLW